MMYLKYTQEERELQLPQQEALAIHWTSCGYGKGRVRNR